MWLLSVCFGRLCGELPFLAKSVSLYHTTSDFLSISAGYFALLPYNIHYTSTNVNRYFVLVQCFFMWYNQFQKGDDLLPISEARKKANRKWNDENLSRLSVSMRKTKKEEVVQAAAAAGQSVNAWIGQAIDERLQRENAEG